jgi:hypothetical protein
MANLSHLRASPLPLCSLAFLLFINDGFTIVQSLSARNSDATSRSFHLCNCASVRCLTAGGRTVTGYGKDEGDKCPVRVCLTRLSHAFTLPSSRFALSELKQPEPEGNLCRVLWWCDITITLAIFLRGQLIRV